MSTDIPVVTPDWLRLREPADADARCVELVDAVRRRLADRSGLTIHDLGSGTGSMARWLAPRLPGRQHWVLYDRDPALLACAVDDLVQAAADGAPVTVEVRQRDITRLGAGDLAGADLITCSALLDMLTAAEVERVAAACAGVGCPTLLTLSVVGRVGLDPADPLDAAVTAAFNAHQRRTLGGRHLLGPDAAAATAAAFARRGLEVTRRPSPWRLGPDRAELAAQWFGGWLDAAVEQAPELAGRASAYRARRLAEAAGGRLRVVVGHEDLLADRA